MILKGGMKKIGPAFFYSRNIQSGYNSQGRMRVLTKALGTNYFGFIGFHYEIVKSALVHLWPMFTFYTP